MELFSCHNFIFQVSRKNQQTEIVVIFEQEYYFFHLKSRTLYSHVTSYIFHPWILMLGDNWSC